jgi:hypothetical protein
MTDDTRITTHAEKEKSTVSTEVPVGSAEMDAVLDIVAQALAKVGPGPEAVIAADPRTVTVDWEASVTAARRDKMGVIRSEVRGWLDAVHVLARLPQVLLIADDGTTIELYGGGMRVCAAASISLRALAGRL